MREILFRGKRLDNGEWVEGFIVASRENTYPDGFEMITVYGINYDELDNYAPDFISYAVDPSTVGQFTGLTDKNGKKIFDGDIVKKVGDKCVVKWDEECANFIIIGAMTRLDFSLFFAKHLEVVGNIHDNPELLENP